MLEKTHRGQAVLWIIVILAIIGLIILWMVKKPESVSITNQTENQENVISPTPTVTPTPSMSLNDIKNGLDDLNTSATEIDKGLNDTQLDVMQ